MKIQKTVLHSNLCLYLPDVCLIFGNVLTFRVKFGVPLDEVCKSDIPGPLLVSDSVCLVEQVNDNMWATDLFCYKQQAFHRYFIENNDLITQYVIV